MERQEVWAYFRIRDRARIVDWLGRVMGQLTVGSVDEEPFVAVYRTPEGEVVRIQSGPEPTCLEVSVSVELSAVRANRGLPWATAPAFARAAAHALGVELLCDPGREYPDVHPLSDTFLRVRAEGEDLVHLYETPEGATKYLPDE